MSREDMAKKRDELFFSLIGQANDNGDHRERLFDCGELGVVHIWNDGCWNQRWLVLEKAEDYLKATP